MSTPATASVEKQRENLKALQRLLAVRKAQESLLGFMRLTMPDPNDPDDVVLSQYETTPLARLLCETFEKVAKGELTRVAISAPPQNGKSAVTSRGAPAWIAGKFPKKNIILATYSQEFAEEFGGDVRSIMSTPQYAQVFPSQTFRKGDRAKGLLVSKEGGRLMFVGRESGATGKPADCVTGDTLVWTEAGEIAIRDLAINYNGVRILSYDSHGKKIVYRPCRAAIVRRAAETFEITFASGAVVRATGNHPWILPGRFVPSAAIAPGDHVMRVVRKTVDRSEQGCLAEYAKRPEEFLLQPPTCRQRAAWSAGEASAGVSAVDEAMPDVQQHLQVDLERDQDRQVQNILLETVRATGSLAADERHAQSEMEARCDAAATAAPLSKGVSIDAPADPSARQPFRRDLRGDVETGSSPHRQLADEQRRVESCDLVQPPSSLVACGEGFETVEDVVSQVDRIREETDVYDVEVEGTHTFFANGIGCLNCIIVDDPIKDDKEAQSPTIQKQVWSWFTKVIMSRAHKNTAIVVVHTRWSQDDLIGRLCDPDHPDHDPILAGLWTRVNIPAVVSEPKLATALGLTLEPQTDPLIVSQFGVKPISSLWPNRHDLFNLAVKKKTDPTGFSALYMGSPTPEDGDYFKREWIIGYKPEELPRNLTKFGASDHAISSKQDRDATCAGVAGVDEDDIFWLLPDLYWERENDTSVIVDQLIQKLLLHRPQIWWAERDHIGKSIKPFLMKRMIEEGALSTLLDDSAVPSRDLQTRARPLQGMMSLRRWRFPTFAPWWPEAQAELLRFPNATHDDFVSFLSWMGTGLMREWKPSRRKPDEKVIAVGSIAWIKAQSAREQRRDERMKFARGM